MNVLSKLSIKNLMLNIKRTISTIIGIILSVALICAVATLATSMQATLVQNAINEYGYYHLQIKDVKKSDIEVLKNNRDIDTIREIGRVGDANIPAIPKEENREETFYRIFSMSKENFDKLKFKLLEGNFPANEKEIVINKRVVTNKGVDLKVGDTVKFDIGEIDFTEDDERVISSSDNNKSFKIVGFIERPNTTFETYDDPYTVITTGMDSVKKDVYITLNNPKKYDISIPKILGGKDFNEVKKSPEKMKYDNFELNNELLRWESFAFSDSTVGMLYSVVGVVLFVILFTSVFCIRNSFAIATTEKIKMYGMLASVGATKKQIRHNVIFECMILGIVGIPVGILSGIFAVFVLLKIVTALIGNSILAFVDGLIFNVTLMPIAVATVLGVLTIYLSAISSARRASKVSPIENLRGSQEIKLNRKKLKTPKVISKLFKTGGVLAYKNLKRSKRKYRTTVTSIAVSIFIFITLNAFITNAFGLTGNYYENYDYNITVQDLNNTLDEQEMMQEILKLDNINESFVSYYTRQPYLITDENKVNNEDEGAYTWSEYYDFDTNESVKVDRPGAPIDIIGLDDATFKKYCKKIGANYEKIKDKAILCDEYTYYDRNTDKMKQFRRYYYNEKDIIDGVYDQKDVKLEIGKVTNINPYFHEGYQAVMGVMVVNTKYYDNFDFKLRSFGMQSDNVDQLAADIKNLDSSIYVHNYEEEARNQNGMIMVINIFLYGFISVITLIGVTNIFNTITSNMELRQKEFAMLKSIGMTKKEFNNMINLETLFYGTKAWIYGTILGLIGTFAMYKAFEVKIDRSMYIPVTPIIISAIFVFVFVFIIMKYSISKINKQNTIETIRKENI